jgi:hypothetical protein
MKANNPYTKSPEDLERLLAPNFSKPVWPGQASNCEQCRYNDQDVDACPCVRCHTRH